MKAFIHTFTQKTGPQHLLTCLQLKKFGEFFQTTCTDYRDPEPKTLAYISNVIRKKLEKRPSRAAASSQ